MAGALVVTLLVIGAFVAFRAFNRSGLQVGPERVDYLAQVRYAQEAGADVVYPAGLPSGWYATQVTVTPGSPAGLELSMLTGGGQYVGLVQSSEPLAQVLTTYVDPHPEAGPSVTISGGVASHWTTWTDAGGDTALAVQRGHGSAQETLLVFGTVSQTDLERLARSLTTAEIGG